MDKKMFVMNKGRRDKPVKNMCILEESKSCSNDILQKVTKPSVGYVQIPLMSSLSNFNMNRLMASNVDKSSNYMGSDYNNMNLNIPDVFKGIPGNGGILHGYTSAESIEYKGKGSQNPASCVMAIVMMQTRPVKAWVRTTLDEILRLGDNAYADLKKRKPFLKNITSIDLNDSKIELDGRRLLVNIEILTVSGTINSKSRWFLSLRDALMTFFQRKSSGIIETVSLAVAIWKDEDFYYVFQPFMCDNMGHRIVNDQNNNKKANQSQAKGKCCVVRVMNINDISILFTNNINRKNKNDYFVIRYVTAIDDLPGAQIWNNFLPYNMGKSLVLRGTISNNSETFEDESRGLQGIAIPIVSLIVAKQVPLADWTKDMVDAVVIEGDSYYNRCVNPEAEDRNLSINKLKYKLHVRKRKVQYELEDSLISGRLKSIEMSNVKNCTIENDLNIFFKKYQCIYGIIEVQRHSLAIWKNEEDSNGSEKCIYYLFDTNPPAQQPTSDKPQEESVACVLRFFNLTDVANYVKKHFKSDQTSDLDYYIHSVNILSIGNEMSEEEIINDKLLLDKPEHRNYHAINEEAAYLQGNFNQSNTVNFLKNTRDRQQAANAYVALTMTKLHDPYMWHSEIIDDILRMGDKLALENTPNIAESEEDEPQRIYLNPSEINDQFIMGIFQIKVSLDEETTSGNVNDLENIVTSFFEDNNMGIIHQDDVAIPIWKEEDVFFMMDPRGRDKTGQPDNNGGATVIWATNITKLSEFLKPSIKQAEEPFFIDAFEIEDIRKLAGEAVETQVQETDTMWFSFQKLSEGVWSINNNSTKVDRTTDCETVTISVVGLLFSKIYKPTKLNSKVLDDIVAVGQKLFKTCKGTQCGDYSFTLNSIPKSLQFASRRFQFIFYDCLYAGKINSNKPDILKLEDALLKHFREFNSGILIIDGEIHLSLYKEDEFYYCILPDYEILRLASINLLAEEILCRYILSEDFEISMIDIISHPVTAKIDCSFNFAIEQLNLPPLNAFKQSENYSQATLNGSINQNLKIMPAEVRGKQTASACAVALGMSILKCPSIWTKRTLDEIMMVGLNIYNLTNSILKKDRVKITDIARIIEIGNNVLTIDIETPATVSGLVQNPPPPPEDDKKKVTDKNNKAKKAGGKKGKQAKIQREKSPVPKVKLLEEGLKYFFNENNAGILVIGNYINAIWRDFDVYYMYNPYGKKQDDAQNGLSYTMWFICLDSLICDIHKNLTQTETFGRYDIHRVIVKTVIIKKFPHPPGFDYYLKSNIPSFVPSALKKVPSLSIAPSNHYHRINDECNILIENVNIDCQSLCIKYRGIQSTATAVVAISIARLHPPSTWTQDIICEILQYGESLHIESACLLRTQTRNLLPHELCTSFVIANFKVYITISRPQISGILNHGDLIHSLNYFFKKTSTGILYVNNAAFAVLEHDSKFYFFHPNLQSNLTSQVAEQAACVLQCSNISQLVTVFIDTYNDKKPYAYTLHEVEVTDMQFFVSKKQTK